MLHLLLIFVAVQAWPAAVLAANWPIILVPLGHPGSKALSLRDALVLAMQPKTLGEPYECAGDSCRCRRPASRVALFRSLGPLVCFSLNRFGNGGTFNAETVVNNRLVELPLSFAVGDLICGLVLPGSPAAQEQAASRYELVGFTVFRGSSLHVGHTTWPSRAARATARRACTMIWPRKLAGPLSFEGTHLAITRRLVNRRVREGAEAGAVKCARRRVLSTFHAIPVSARTAALITSRTTLMTKPSPTAATIWPELATASYAAMTRCG